jgi:site-specific recombinase XerD
MKDVADFPSLLETFFTRRLIAQRKASPHTIASYRDTFRLLLQFAEKRLAKAPSRLTMEDLNAPFLAQLDWLIKRHSNRRNLAEAVDEYYAVWRDLNPEPDKLERK